MLQPNLNLISYHQNHLNIQQTEIATLSKDPKDEEVLGIEGCYS